MPHFFAEQLNNIKYPIISGDFEFIFEATSFLGDKTQSLILIKHVNEYFLLIKQNQKDKILIKYNRHLKVNSISIVKQALNEYAKLTNAKIIFHNLSFKKKPKNIQNKYFLNIEDLDELDESFFKDISIEIGFGSGKNILDLAKNNPNQRFLGLEIYRPAITQVLNQIDILGLDNLFIINADCRNLFDILPSNIANCIYLHFPMPWDKNPKKRVFSGIFLEKCMRILLENGFLELRTDSKDYFIYAMDIAKEYENIQIEHSLNSKKDILSKYESRWISQNKDIFNAKFILKNKTNKQQFIKNEKFILKSLDIMKILQDNDLKFRNEEYFLHIKSIYKYQSIYVLFVLFGSLNVPSKTYLIISDKGEVNFLGDIIPTKANIDALKILEKKYGMN